MDGIEEMIKTQLNARDITDPKVLKAMREVDRSLFVPEDLQHLSYADRPLPIGKNQTISQPYIVAYMAQELDLKESDKVLEIGTGCGYNAAVMAQLVKEVFSIEIVDLLAEQAKKNLENVQVHNVKVRQGDGYEGWPEVTPFDIIVLTAAAPEIPKTLKNQLKIGGRLLAPVGKASQKLLMIKRMGEDEFKENQLHMVSFVPMTGKVQED